MPAPDDTRLPALQMRIVVVGGGIAGAEAALTLAIGLPAADVLLVAASPTISLLPDLVYVPFGVTPRRLDIGVDQLLPHGVRSRVAHVDRVDTTRRVVETETGEIPYDVLVVAPGAIPEGESDRSFCSLDDALRVRRELAQLVERADAGATATITIRSESDDSWTAPACELALLMGNWLRTRRLDSRIELLVATADHDVFEWFGPVGEVTVERALRRSRVQVATGVPAGRFDALGGDLVIEFGRLRAREIDGVPGLGTNGWYQPGGDFRVAPDVFVVGDAIDLPYRAGFATAWQARRVLRALGGETARIGAFVDDIPSGSVEYQMDLADGVMRARITSAAGALAHPYLGHDADITVVPGARPDKLAGLLLHDRVIRWHAAAHDAPLAYRDALHRRVAQ